MIGKITRVEDISIKRGRKNQNAAKRELAGKPKKGKEPSVEQQGLTCPPWLHPYAQEEWQIVYTELNRIGLLGKIDGSSLAGYCSAVAEFRLAHEALNKDGRYYMDKFGNRRCHKAVEIQQKALQSIRQFSSEFGLNPLSRVALTMPEPETINPFDAFKK